MMLGFSTAGMQRCQDSRCAPQARAIEVLLKGGITVICCGGGGIPVAPEPDGRHRRGVEAVRHCAFRSHLPAQGSLPRKPFWIVYGLHCG